MLQDVRVFTPSYFSDERGELWTVYDKKNLNIKFNHDKVAISKKNVLRGLHGDKKSWKLITCLSGEIFLSIVDFRKNSSSFLKTQSFILNNKNKISVLIPPNFLNGHYVLSEEAVFFYKWSYKGEYPDIDDQFSIIWSDPFLNIDWPNKNPILSDRDKNSKPIDIKLLKKLKV